MATKRYVYKVIVESESAMCPDSLDSAEYNMVNETAAGAAGEAIRTERDKHKDRCDFAILLVERIGEEVNRTSR